MQIRKKEFISKYNSIFHHVSYKSLLQTNTNYIYLDIAPANDISAQIRNMTYQSRSPLSRNMPGISPTPPNSPNATYTPPSPNLDVSSSAIYGDPSYLASAERRRNRRFL